MGACVPCVPCADRLCPSTMWVSDHDRPPPPPFSSRQGNANKIEGYNKRVADYQEMTDKLEGHL